ncbi:MAG: hypothetical protein IKR12_00215 [Clostridia bacterium]|nr:hypothetical protein [Clostridia bacterium]
MKFRYNIFSFVTAIMFVLAFLCVMVSYATYFMFYPAMIFFEAGFVMLSIKLIKDYSSKKENMEQKEDVIVMELASGEDGEAYVMQQDKKKKRRKSNANFDRLLPAIFSILAAVLFVYLFISSIITHI